MFVHKLERKQLIKSDIHTLWTFFSDAKNLSVITPSYMKFKITSAIPKNGIYEGQIITYKVSPILNIPLSWMTEITHIEPNKRFIDEQRTGPYTLWHHEHWFDITSDGVLMTDIVYYQLPLYFIGDIAHFLFIKRQLNNIFDFRYRKIEELFNKR